MVGDDHYAVALTFSDLGYIGMVSAAIMDFDKSTSHTASELVVMPLGRMGVPASSEVGDVEWSNKRCSVRFAHVEGGRRLSFAMEGFDGTDGFEAETISVTDYTETEQITNAFNQLLGR